MKIKKTKFNVFLFTIFYFFTSFSPCYASFITSKTNYTLNELVCVLIAISKYGLTIVGALVLLFFIYGGFVYLTSGGSQERITSGKNILVNSVIGLLIILASAIIIDFTMKALGYNNPDWRKLDCTAAPQPHNHRHEHVCMIGPNFQPTDITFWHKHRHSPGKNPDHHEHDGGPNWVGHHSTRDREIIPDDWSKKCEEANMNLLQGKK